MNERLEDICTRPQHMPPEPTRPMAPGIFPAAVYACDDLAQVDQLLEQPGGGYVYRRDGQPNADCLAEKCRQLHAADRAVVCASGMAALSTALLARLRAGDQVLVSNRLYGRTVQLFGHEAERFGIKSTTVDCCDLNSLATALDAHPKMLIVETISNPTLRVVDIARIATMCRQRNVTLLVDNTFASPVVCRPLEHGADLVMESLTKIMNGHSDVLLGLLCGREAVWDRIPEVITTWGFSPAPLDCWLAARGIGTLALRAQRASASALAIAEQLAGDDRVDRTIYPGLAGHSEHAVAQQLFSEAFGSIVTFSLPGGRGAVERFIAAARDIPLSPSLGDLSTTLSHPATTSHRGLTDDQRADLEIDDSMLRLSVGIESLAGIQASLEDGLVASAG